MNPVHSCLRGCVALQVVMIRDDDREALHPEKNVSLFWGEEGISTVRKEKRRERERDEGSRRGLKKRATQSKKEKGKREWEQARDKPYGS